MADECIFCDIGAGKIDSEILYRDDGCFVIRDIAPKAPSHLLVIPNEHFTYLEHLTPHFYPVLGRMLTAAAEMAGREGIDASGYRLVFNQREDAGQQVPHLHLHLLGGKPLRDMG